MEVNNAKSNVTHFPISANNNLKGCEGFEKNTTSSGNLDLSINAYGRLYVTGK